MKQYEHLYDVVPRRKKPSVFFLQIEIGIEVVNNKNQWRQLWTNSTTRTMICWHLSSKRGRVSIAVHNTHIKNGSLYRDMYALFRISTDAALKLVFHHVRYNH